MKSLFKHFLLALLYIALTAACSSQPAQYPPKTEAPAKIAAPVKLTQAKKIVRSNWRSPSSNRNNFAQRLARHYQNWRATPYRFGGTNRQGIDCSGFVYITFRDLQGIALPRTTAKLSQVGRRISVEQLAAGDLVFFDTGPRQTHVGIYLSGGKFVHASTSRGVITSNMDSPYWSGVYRESRRPLTQGEAG